MEDFEVVGPRLAGSSVGRGRRRPSRPGPARPAPGAWRTSGRRRGGAAIRSYLGRQLVEAGPRRPGRSGARPGRPGRRGVDGRPRGGSSNPRVRASRVDRGRARGRSRPGIRPGFRRDGPARGGWRPTRRPAARRPGGPAPGASGPDPGGRARSRAAGGRFSAGVVPPAFDVIRGRAGPRPPRGPRGSSSRARSQHGLRPVVLPQEVGRLPLVELGHGGQAATFEPRRARSRCSQSQLGPGAWGGPIASSAAIRRARASSRISSEVLVDGPPSPGRDRPALASGPTRSREGLGPEDRPGREAARAAERQATREGDREPGWARLSTAVPPAGTVRDALGLLDPMRPARGRPFERSEVDAGRPADLDPVEGPPLPRPAGARGGRWPRGSCPPPLTWRRATRRPPR